jgi:prevent-host-death family protein
MRISMADAAGQLAELSRLANQGEEIVLTQNGYPEVRLQPMRRILTPEERDEAVKKIQRGVKEKNLSPGPDAARSQDFLYDEYCLPK